MFGFSFSELIVVIVVALVVIGPKELPKMLRKLGKWAGQLRRMASELRAQSGIDDALRTEGLADDIAEIRKLARGELDAVQRSVVDTGASARPADPPAFSPDFYVIRDREYPRDGADAYGALPDNAIVYAHGLPKSKWARDPLYVLGDANAELPPEPDPKTFAERAAEEEAAEEAATEPTADASTSTGAGGTGEAGSPDAPAPEAH